MSEPVFKIVGAADWARARQTGVVPWSDADERDGFMHLSMGAQVLDTARLHFAGRRDCLALEIDPARLRDPLRYERSEKRAQLFPHLYGALPVSAVMRVFELAPDGPGYSFGAESD